MSQLNTERCAVEYPHLAHNGSHGTRVGHTYVRCPGVKIDPASRAQPTAAREHVLTELRQIKERLSLRIAMWNVTGVIHGNAASGTPRKVEEFPENNVRAWVNLASVARVTATEAADLAVYAERRADAVRRFYHDATERARRAGAVEL